MKSEGLGGGRNMTVVGVLLAVLTAGAWGWGAAPKWAEAIGGDGDESAFSIQQTADSGAIVAGYGRKLISTPYSYDGILVVKLDGKGAIKWQKAYTEGLGGADLRERTRVVRQTKDGGYIVAGGVETPPSCLYQALVLKLDESGNMVWQKTYGGRVATARSIQQTSDGGYILAIEVEYLDYRPTDIWLLKLDANGNITWQKKYGSRQEYEYPTSIQQTGDKGYIVAGGVHGKEYPWTHDGILLKVDSVGNLAWWKKFGGAKNDRVQSVHQTKGRGYVVGGYTTSYGSGEQDAWVVKFDSGGAIEWQKTYGGTKNDTAESVQQTKDGGYVFAGMTELVGSYSDAWLVKLDKQGLPAFQKYFGAQVGPQSAKTAWQTKDLGFLLAGFSPSFGGGDADLWVIRADKTGLINAACEATGDTAATVKDSTATVSDYTAEVATTYATPVAGTLVAVTTQATTFVVCGGAIAHSD
ncbi:MAG: hypothetical protein AB1714_10320 [Acidobacteriota bacterium]